MGLAAKGWYDTITQATALAVRRKAPRVIPTANDLRSSPLTHRPPTCSPPARTNFLGCVQAQSTHRVVHLNFPRWRAGTPPPGSCSCDGRLFRLSGEPVTFNLVPGPHRAQRELARVGGDVHDGSRLGQTAAMGHSPYATPPRHPRRLRAGSRCMAASRAQFDGWRQPSAPSEGATAPVWTRLRRAVIFTAPSAPRACKGWSHAPLLRTNEECGSTSILAPGERFEAAYVPRRR